MEGGGAPRKMARQENCSGRLDLICATSNTLGANLQAASSLLSFPNLLLCSITLWMRVSGVCVHPCFVVSTHSYAHTFGFSFPRTLRAHTLCFFGHLSFFSEMFSRDSCLEAIHEDPPPLPPLSPLKKSECGVHTLRWPPSSTDRLHADTHNVL